MNNNTAFYSVAGQRGLSGYCLKMTAVVTMLIDHAAASLLYQMIVLMPEWGPITPDNLKTWQTIYWACRIIGRMAFPVYCFLLVEGFFHTKSRGKYALRLFVFGVISEVPFDLALHRNYFEPNYNNVYWTLFIGLLTIWAADEIGKRIPKAGEKWFTAWFTRLIVMAAGAALAELLNTDYGANGVFAIYILYLFYGQRLVGFATAVTALAIDSMIEFAALFMLIPLKLYDGSRGRQMKYFFYAFYPAHLLVLWLIGRAMGIM